MRLPVRALLYKIAVKTQMFQHQYYELNQLSHRDPIFHFVAEILLYRAA